MAKAKDSLGPVKEMLGGLHRSGTALITKGTAMGPLVPLLLLTPILGVKRRRISGAYLLAAELVTRGPTPSCASESDVHTESGPCTHPFPTEQSLHAARCMNPSVPVASPR